MYRRQEHTLVYPDAIPGQETSGLFLLDLATLQSRQITNPPPNSEGDGDPVFSHDGKTLAFQRSSLDLEQIYTMPSSGGDARLLTSNFITDFIDGLAWTSDNREIIFGGNQLRRVAATAKGTIDYAHLLRARSGDVSGDTWELACLCTVRSQCQHLEA